MSGGTLAGRVPVLMYHRVEPVVAGADRAYAVSRDRFAAHLHWLAVNGWQPCTLRAFDAWFSGREHLPERSVLITFDDGFAGLHEHVMPLLAERGWPATVFLVSGLIGLDDRWIAREHGVAARHALLDRGQIAEMAALGFEFHSHSADHLDLTTLDDAALRQQVAGSRAALQEMLGTAVDFFAYPFGRHDERVRSAVQAAGYGLAFSVDPGFNRPGQNRHAVRRLDITGHDTVERFGRKVTLGGNDGSRTAQWRYLAARIGARLGLGGST